MIIRRAGNADADLLAALNSEVQELHVHAAPELFRVVEPSEVAAWFQAQLADGATAWIAEDAGTAVGYALAITRHRPEGVFGKARHFVEIDQVGVLLSARRRGVCRALIDRIRESARTEGIGQLVLKSWVFNSAAHHAFRALGFAPESIQFVAEI
ncbi:MAG: GNAT family N-acetyltransferase [Gemmatimonadaceae bacterium]|nr:GNAT family N-acetyltransferase [Gemmatimonadaceae bacterium]